MSTMEYYWFLQIIFLLFLSLFLSFVLSFAHIFYSTYISFIHCSPWETSMDENEDERKLTKHTVLTSSSRFIHKHTAQQFRLCCSNSHRKCTTIFSLFSLFPSFHEIHGFLIDIRCFFFSSDFGIAYHTDMFYACWAEEHITTYDVVHSRENNSFGIWACISMTKYQIWSSAVQTILRSQVTSKTLCCNEKKKCPKYN